MTRKKKEYEQSAALPFDRVTTSESLSGSLRTLVNGLFGKKKAYQPTTQQIADYYLTPREREVAYLAALGFGEKEIADALGMNFQTVHVHLRNVLNKMDVESVRALREYFLHNGENDSRSYRR
ncbi:MAG TPA: LuxR C-terminal-related transcriptional regulator [Anaerolineae bacterium]|nr:LuxR C-terminal-related transcriptional regulator [Anaerolineae bacterium]